MKKQRLNCSIQKLLLANFIILLVFLLSYKLVNHKHKHQTDQYIEKINQLSTQFPPSQSNKYSQKLDLLLVDLGLKPVNNNNLKVDQAKEEEFNKIRSSLTDFILSQSLKNTIQSQTIPTDLQKYLNENQEEIAQIKDFILTSQTITWNFDVNDFNKTNPLNIVLPNFVGLMDLQRIFLLQILADNQKGDTETINTTLESSLKLNQAIQRYPYLISQLVSRTVSSLQDGIIRQVDYLSPQSQVILDNYDYNFSENMIKAFNLELLLVSSPLLFEEVQEQNKLIKPFQKIAYKFIQINNKNGIRNLEKSLVKLQKSNICTFNMSDFQEVKKNKFWSNLPQFLLTNDMLVKYWAMAGNTMLDRELTKQIIKAKLSYAQRGKYSDSLSNLNSQACSPQQWQYQQENNQLIISLTEQEGINSQRKELQLYTKDSIPPLDFILSEKTENKRINY